MIIDILFLSLFFCQYVEYHIDMSGYSLCQHKCRQTLCRPQHYTLLVLITPFYHIPLSQTLSHFENGQSVITRLYNARKRFLLSLLLARLLFHDLKTA